MLFPRASDGLLRIAPAPAQVAAGWIVSSGVRILGPRTPRWTPYGQGPGRPVPSLERLDGDLVERDIAARRREAEIGFEFAVLADRIEAALRATGSNPGLDQWCRRNIGCDISTMRRRKRLHARWGDYEAKRRMLGSRGQAGLLFALSLVSEQSSMSAMNRQALPVRSLGGTDGPRVDASRCRFVTGDALTELRGMGAGKVNVIVTSPPYWPAKATYRHGGVGFEGTIGEYIGNLVSVFREAKRVLRNDGTLWISIDDCFRNGSLSFIPARLAMAMVDDGWICRAEIAWEKSNGHPGTIANRPARDHETLLMFVKGREYFYDPDPIRVPPTGQYNQSGHRIPASMRNRNDRHDRYHTNPLGRHAGSMWRVEPTVYRNGHTATFPLELVRRTLLASCPGNGLVLDIFGGAGTTALAALRLGHRAISIEINPAYTREAEERIAAELGREAEASAAE